MAKVISYGSNLSTIGMKARAPSAHNPAVIMLKGWRLVFRSYYATIKPCEDGVVPCVVWEVDDVDLDNIDIYEGCPDFYSRHDTQYGSIYIMNEPYSNEPKYPSVHYIAGIVNGYKEFGIDRQFYLDADEEFKEAMSR